MRFCSGVKGRGVTDDETESEDGDCDEVMHVG